MMSFAHPFTSVLRPALLAGGALLLLGVPIALAEVTSCRCRADPALAPSSAYVFELDATEDPDCFYGSAFNNGPVVFGSDGSDGQPIVLTQTYEWQDGCTWEVREVLTPHGAGLYAYEYTEHAASCEPDATPARACARRGVVTVSALDPSGSLSDD